MTNQERPTTTSRVFEQITEGTSPVRRKLYRVEQVAEVLNVGRTKVFDLIRSGHSRRSKWAARGGSLSRR
jgi:excisionase family DNA binding protein